MDRQMKNSPIFREEAARQLVGAMAPIFSPFPGRDSFSVSAELEGSHSHSAKDDIGCTLPAREKAALLDAILKTADKYFAQNHLVVARDFLTLLDHFGGHTDETLQTLGNLHFLLADFAPARAAFERALEQSPDNAGLWVCLAATSRCLNDAAHFERCLSRALSLQPGNPDALKLQADSHLDQRRYEDAVTVYTSLLGRYPDQVEVLLSLAKCHFRLGDPNKTRALLTQALEMDPANELVQENLRVLKSLSPKV
jgi:tetratricopeptide (TPR) repeat protein